MKFQRKPANISNSRKDFTKWLYTICKKLRIILRLLKNYFFSYNVTQIIKTLKNDFKISVKLKNFYYKFAIFPTNRRYYNFIIIGFRRWSNPLGWTMINVITKKRTCMGIFMEINYLLIMTGNIILWGCPYERRNILIHNRKLKVSMSFQILKNESKNWNRIIWVVQKTTL